MSRRTSVRGMLLGLGTALALTIAATPAGAQTKLVEEMSRWKYLKGTAAPPAGWNTVDFDDSAWDEGPAPLGYSGDLTYGTTIDDMQNGYLSLFIRHTFDVDRAFMFTRLKLRMKWDDGFVAYLNGVEIQRANLAGTVGAPVPYNQAATDHETNSAFQDFYLGCAAVEALRDGDNVLAIQGHNVNLTSSDFSLEAELEDASDDDICPFDLAAVISTSNAEWVRVSWKRPANVTYTTVKLLRNGVEVDPPVTSVASTIYTDKSPAVGNNLYVLIATACVGEECRVQKEFTFEGPGVKFRRGDADGSGVTNLTDAIFILAHLFQGGPAPDCPDAADVDDDGAVSLTDPIFLLDSLFKGGSEPPSPGITECGVDPDTSPDDLGPCTYTAC